MKKLFAFILIILTSLALAQTDAPAWVAEPSGYINTKDQVGIYVRDSSPGEMVATAFSYNAERDSDILGNCEEIYFRGKTLSSLLLTKRSYSAQVLETNYFYADIFKGLGLGDVLSGRFYCIVGKSKLPVENTSLDYEIPLNNTRVVTQILGFSEIEYKYNEVKNTLSISVVGVSPKK